jgi:hypothetical protein
MIPLLILTVPPTATGCSYFLWYQGSSLAQSSKKLAASPPQSLSTYALGLTTLAASYTLQSSLIQSMETSPPSASGLPSAPKYTPPKSIGEIASRLGSGMGGPLLKRAGAAGASFFVAGYVQTYAAALWNE